MSGSGAIVRNVLATGLPVIVVAGVYKLPTVQCECACAHVFCAVSPSPVSKSAVVLLCSCASVAQAPETRRKSPENRVAIRSSGVGGGGGLLLFSV